MGHGWRVIGLLGVLALALLGQLPSAGADTPSVTMTLFRPRKLLYTPGEAGFVDAALANARAAAVTVTLTVTLVREFTRVSTPKSVTVTLKPGSSVIRSVAIRQNR